MAARQRDKYYLPFLQPPIPSAHRLIALFLNLPGSQLKEQLWLRYQGLRALSIHAARTQTTSHHPIFETASCVAYCTSSSALPIPFAPNSANNFLYKASCAWTPSLHRPHSESEGLVYDYSLRVSRNLRAVPPRHVYYDRPI